MNQSEIVSILKTIKYLLGTKFFSWRLEGSANLLVQGVDTTVNDIDIATNLEGFLIFKKALAKYNPTETENERIGRKLTCQINGVPLEILYYDDSSLRMLDKIKQVTWNELTLSILPLESALEFYRKIHRLEKVSLLERHLREDQEGYVRWIHSN